MASTAPTPAFEAHTLASLQHDRRTTALGLLWGGVLMVMLAFWLPAKHPDVLGAVPAVAWILALAAFVAALGLFAVRPRGTAEEQRQKLVNARRPVGAVLTVAGMALLVLSVVLASWYRLEAFGEAFGMVLLGLIAVAWGLAHLRPIDRSLGHNQILQFLLERRELISVALFALAGVLIVVAGVWGIRPYRWAAFPEWGAAILIALIATGGGIWLRASAGRPVTLAALRLFVLVVGGLTGLVIAVMTLLRGVTLGGEFFRGPAGWSGADAWKLWLVIYLEMIGLALMFASLSLAQVEIRVSAFLRRLLYGYNAVLNGLLLLTILIVLNIVIYVAYPYTFDWTETRGFYALSPNSKRLLENLKEPTKIYVVLSPNFKIYGDLHNLLDNAQAFTDRLQVVYMSPDRDPNGYERLAKRYPEMARDKKAQRDLEDNMALSGRGVLIVYGPESDDPSRKAPPHSFLNVSSLADVKRDMSPERRNRQTFLFKGEPAIMTELQFLMENKQKPKVYFLQDDGEFELNDLQGGIDPRQGGLGMFVDRLKKENYETRGLSFKFPPRNARDDDPVVYAKASPDGKKEVPADAKVVVIAGPREPLKKEVIDALDRFADRNGKLVVLVDVDTGTVDPKTLALAPSPLVEWLRKYGVDVTNDFVFRLPESQTDSPRIVPVAPAPEARNPIAKNFRGSNKTFRMYWVRVVRPQAGGPASPFQAETILQAPANKQNVFTASRVGVLEDPFTAAVAILRQLRQGEGEDKLAREPPSVAVAVTDRDQKPRMVVMGSSYFITNYFMERPASGAYDLQASFLEWLAERPGGMDIRAKETTNFNMDPNVSRSQLVLLPGWLMAIGIIGLGTGIWVVRRR